MLVGEWNREAVRRYAVLVSPHPIYHHYAMLTLEQAQAAILKGIRPATVTEAVPIANARGRFLAQALSARVDNPAFDNSAMDGYALRAADLAAHGFVLPLVGESSCGNAPGALAPASTMRIFTGAPLPAGADTVVMQEDVQVASGRVTFPKTTAADQNIRRRGEDFRAGEPLYQPGRQLTAYDLALLSAAGVADVPAYERARVLVVATGNELIAPGTALKPGQIYESNRLATLLQLQQLGLDTVDGGTARDDPQELRGLLKRAAGDFDFIISSGGASVGDHDLVKQVFAEIGTIDFWKASIKPGKPIAFGHVGERAHFFALPGNPVSSLVTYKLFVEPALIAWHHGRAERVELTAVAGNDFRRRPGRTEFLRARLASDNGHLVATALPGQGSHMLGAFRETNALIKIAVESAGFSRGDAVIVTPLQWVL